VSVQTFREIEYRAEATEALRHRIEESLLRAPAKDVTDTHTVVRRKLTARRVLNLRRAIRWARGAGL
jgi:hypothetical protein